LGYPPKAAENDDSIVIIVNPDTILLRPLKHTFYDYPEEYWIKTPRPRETRVQHGFPIAQAYGYGVEWLSTLKNNLTFVFGPNSPILK